MSGSRSAQRDGTGDLEVLIIRKDPAEAVREKYFFCAHL